MAHGTINRNGKSTHHRKSKERVTGTYTDIYLAEDYCEYQRPVKKQIDEDEEECASSLLLTKDIWKSPSDYLIGLLASTPPFTSKVLRSNTHNGILAFGDNVLEIERDEFDEDLTDLIEENEAAWKVVLEHKREIIQEKVKIVRAQALSEKTKIFLSETTKFYEKTLQEMEDKLRAELKVVLVNIRANVINNFNIMGRTLMKSKKEQLDTFLKSKFHCEVMKIKQYYHFLLTQLLHQHKKVIKQAQIEKNDTIRAFLNQAEAENVTATMYILCEERKKCNINKFVMKNYQMSEMSELKNTLKKTQNVLNDLHYTKSESTKNWEDKITKIAHLFLKFIGFSLKLLPEQTTFLLDLEKMVVLQLNEIQKSPGFAHSILMDKNNCFDFEKIEPPQVSCDKKPFEIIGDMRDDVPIQYGSSETVPLEANLPYIRVGRQYTYAKCENFQQVKDFMMPQKCQCRSYQEEEVLEDQINNEKDRTSIKTTSNITFQNKDSSLAQSVTDIHQLKECPVTKCQRPFENNNLLPIDLLLNYTEENFEKLQLIQNNQESLIDTLKLINPVDEVFKDVPFSETKERCRNVETQFSSQESLFDDCLKRCSCNNVRATTHVNSTATSTTNHKKDRQKNIEDIMQERKWMLLNLIHSHPNLLNIFTEESFNLQF